MKKEPESREILGINVASIQMSRVLEILQDRIDQKAHDKPFFLITAYSESFLEAERSRNFKEALQKADLVVGDGVSVWAATDFAAEPARGWARDWWKGMAIGYKVISGGYPERPEGVKIFKALLEGRKYKKFLLGGFGGVAERLANKYGCGWREDKPGVVEQINEYKPDVLFVALGRFKQEIWIAENLINLKCKVVIGVGSAFDEMAGEGVWRKQVPEWISSMGLKWLWRAFVDPKHIIRALRAFPIFPLKVYWRYETRRKR